MTTERGGASPGHRRFPGAKGDRWLLAWAVFIAILLLLPLPLPPDLLFDFGGPDGLGVDKIGHVVVFFVLALLAVAPARARLPRPVLIAALASLVYGAVLELVQAALPWRSAELADLLADGVGATLGAMTSLWRGRW